MTGIPDPTTSRRALLKGGAAAAAGVAAGAWRWAPREASAHTPPPPDVQPPAADGWRGLKVGVATYSLRKLPLEQAIRGVQRVGLRYVSIKDVHVPAAGASEARRAGAAQFRAAGITPLSTGTFEMRDEAEARLAFEYARDVGALAVVCNPRPAVLPALDRLVRQYDIRAAIHNHGPGSVWPSPYDAWEQVARLDRRVGLCIDVGHTGRAGVDPAQAIRRCRERLYDVHLKDNDAAGPTSGNAVVGRGVLDVPAIVRALLDTGYAHHVGFEYELDPDDPLPGLAESVGYLRAVVAGAGAPARRAG